MKQLRNAYTRFEIKFLMMTNQIYGKKTYSDKIKINIQTMMLYIQIFQLNKIGERLFV